MSKLSKAIALHMISTEHIYIEVQNLKFENLS